MAYCSFSFYYIKFCSAHSSTPIFTVEGGCDLATTVVLFGICLSHLWLWFSLDWLHFQTTSLHVVANMSTSNSRLIFYKLYKFFSQTLAKVDELALPELAGSHSYSWPYYCGSVDSIHWLIRCGSHNCFWGQFNIARNIWIESKEWVLC